MFFKQFYLGCLAHASYLIGSDGVAAIVDPQRDVDRYVLEAAAARLKIKYVIETHLHADFVSGHRELAERTGATIVFGHNAGVTFPHLGVRDGDEIAFGNVILRFLETPGHTPESMSVLVIDRAVSLEPQKILTGDTLFIGDVGRPDLAVAKGHTAEGMAAMLYHSLHEKLLKLDDRVEVYPAHGAGSMCGRNISQETSSTIGKQRAFNYALQPMSKDEFVRMMTTELPPAPSYFPYDAEFNRTGAASLKDLRRPLSLGPDEVSRLSQEGHLVLDVRSANEFGTGHVPNAINIGLSGQFASWAGTLLSMDAPIIIVAASREQVDEAILRLARVGLETVKAFLKDGMEAWIASGLETRTVQQITVNELKERLESGSTLQVIDVRRPAEYAGGHAPSAVSLPLTSEIEASANQFDSNRPTAIICAGGYRSSAASSLFARQGFEHLLNVSGGTNAWIQAGYTVEH